MCGPKHTFCLLPQDWPGLGPPHNRNTERTRAHACTHGPPGRAMTACQKNNKRDGQYKNVLVFKNIHTQ